jgi:2-succinyl-6-hydroxy-2,4-cyclohexadiene-1-carboxylate synthase
MMRSRVRGLARAAGVLAALLCASGAGAQPAEGVSANGLHYKVEGVGPVVVLIHAFQMDLREWDAVAPALAKSRRVVRYDVRGHGSSKLVSPPPSTVADLGALLDELKVPRATLVGLSMGATVAMDFALTHPDRVERLVLVSPGPPGIPGGAMPDWMGTVAAAAKAGKADEAGRLWWESPMFDRVRKDEAAAAAARAVVTDNADIWKLRERPPAMVPATGTRVAELAMPTLVVAGEQDELGSAAIARAMADKLRRGRLVMVPGAGHMLSLERPAELAALILDR